MSTVWDGFVPQYLAGEPYDVGRVVRYQNILYRSLVGMEASDTVPPLNPVEWAEIRAHGIGGYDFSADRESVNMLTAASETVSFVNATRIIMPITSLDDLGGVLYTLTDDGAIRSNIDGLVITLQARPIRVHPVWTGADFNAHFLSRMGTYKGRRNPEIVWWTPSIHRKF